jgi:predicted dehydrogenase
MDTRYTGGFIVDAGVHTTALLRLLLGEFESGRGTIRSVTPVLGAYDTLSFRFRMSSGVDGVMNLFYSSKGYRANAVHVFGGNGTLIVERQRLVLMREGSDDLVEEYPDDLGYRREFENFHAAVRNNEAIVSTFDEGYRDYMVIYEAVMSSIEGRDAVFTNAK